jgi:hypothetical protein
MVSEWSPKIDVTSGGGVVKGHRGGEGVSYFHGENETAPT